jgi:hypothetical protein
MPAYVMSRMPSNSLRVKAGVTTSHSHFTIEAGEPCLYKEEDKVLVEIVLYVRSRYLPQHGRIGSGSESPSYNSLEVSYKSGRTRSQST